MPKRLILRVLFGWLLLAIGVVLIILSVATPALVAPLSGSIGPALCPGAGTLSTNEITFTGRNGDKGAIMRYECAANGVEHDVSLFVYLGVAIISVPLIFIGNRLAVIPNTGPKKGPTSPA